jgi:hypothetical protein
MNRIGIALIVLVSAIAPAFAESEETIFVRLKGGAGFYSNLDPISSAPGIGLDVGYRSPSGFGVTGSSFIFFEADEPIVISNSTLFQSASVKFFGIAPTYSVIKGKACISFSLAVGGLLVSTGSGTNSFSIIPVTVSEFALAPSIDADFRLTDTFSVNGGIRFIKSIGGLPNLAIISPTIGIGLVF